MAQHKPRYKMLGLQTELIKKTVLVFGFLFSTIGFANDLSWMKNDLLAAKLSKGLGANKITIENLKARDSWVSKQAIKAGSLVVDGKSLNAAVYTAVLIIEFVTHNKDGLDEKTTVFGPCLLTDLKDSRSVITSDCNLQYLIKKDPPLEISGDKNVYLIGTKFTMNASVSY